MGVAKEVMVHAMRATTSPDKAADLIAAYEAIRGRVVDRAKKITSIRDAAERKVADLMLEELCRHDVIKTHGDPSGNGDTSRECLICGEWMRDKPVRFT